jgi:protein required for attachment to host cells
MSTSIKLPHGTWVIVADGRKALLLANEDDAAYPDLRVSRLFESPPNPRTSVQGADRPGRKFFSHRRSAVGQTDWHRLGEAQFAAKLVDTLFTGPLPAALILVAPPAFLAELRKQLPKQARSIVLAEIDKDFTHLPADEIEQRVLGLQSPAEVL